MDWTDHHDELSFYTGFEGACVYRESIAFDGSEARFVGSGRALQREGTDLVHVINLRQQSTETWAREKRALVIKGINAGSLAQTATHE
jgi:hypothetical protein